MQAVNVNGDDIIHLNIGGQKFSTTRSTLCQVEGSLLATMFSGRWEDNLKRDENGAIFFDLNPRYFGLIMDYLRAKKIATLENPPSFPKVPEDEAINFSTFVSYLGLSGEFLEVTETPEDNSEIPASVRFSSDTFALHGSRVTLQEAGTVAQNSSHGGYEYVIGKNDYKGGVVHWKLRLELFTHNKWIFVGIVRWDDPHSNDWCSYRWPGSYGWAVGKTGQIWRRGLSTIDETLKNLSKQGDIVELVLDVNARKLSLCLPTGQQFHMVVPFCVRWKLNVNLSSPNDKVRIVSDEASSI